MTGEQASADISPCGTYRYNLSRWWGDGPRVAWVMLNPSKADALKDDATIRRVRGFTKRFGYDGFTVVNLFAYRATDPRDLLDAAERGVDIVGPENDAHIYRTVWCEDWMNEIVVLGWGAHATVWQPRVEKVLEMLPSLACAAHLDERTKDGQPRHPLMLRKKALLYGWDDGAVYDPTTFGGTPPWLTNRFLLKGRD